MTDVLGVEGSGGVTVQFESWVKWMLLIEACICREEDQENATFSYSTEKQVYCYNRFCLCANLLRFDLARSVCAHLKLNLSVGEHSSQSNIWVQNQLCASEGQEVN